MFISDDPEAAAEMRGRWERQVPGVTLVIVESPYRALAGPLMAYLDVLDLAWPPGKPEPITFVVVPEYVARHWWERILYNQSARRLRTVLLGRPHTVVVDVPYRRDDPAQVQRLATRTAEPPGGERGRAARRRGLTGRDAAPRRPPGARRRPATRGVRRLGVSWRRRDDRSRPGKWHSPRVVGYAEAPGSWAIRRLPSSGAPLWRSPVVIPTGRSLPSPPSSPGAGHAELVGVHVVEIDWTLPLDADVAGRSEDAQRVLDIAEATAEAGRYKHGDRSCSRPATSERRSSTRRPSGRPTCVIAGLPFRRRFGGDFAIGRTIPYILKNAPCTVWVIREADARGASMKAVIVGCGRVGASLADELDRAGWQVLLIDVSTSAFDRLPAILPRDRQLRGDGTDEDSLRRAGAEDADLFLALTEGDNRNVMAAQLAVEALGARRCVAKINDPVRAEAYAHLGIASLCRTNLMTSSCSSFAGQVAPRAPGHLRAGPAARARRRGGRAAGVASPTPAATARVTRRSARPAPVRARLGGLIMFVLVVGGGKVGYYLTKELIESGHEVALMEKDRARAQQIADEIGSVVIAQDGCEGKYLNEAGANRADIVAAVTGDDEDNLVICQMAKHHFDVPRTIARVNNPKNEALFRHLGVDEIISPTRMILGSIEQDIPVHELLHLAALGVGELEIIEAPPPARARRPSAGRARPVGPQRAARCSA